MRDENDTRLSQAAGYLEKADGWLVTAGAGMGVDSGLPDFRGPQGFWKAYPALGRAGLCFEEVASPRTFVEDPSLAWGFYGHRLALYRRVQPHRGFELLLNLSKRLAKPLFVLTSNVDGQFQKAGFAEEGICEVHGSIHYLQCCSGCCSQIWSADAFEPNVDEAQCRLLGPCPTCRACGGLARPNILMFGDDAWLPAREARQRRFLSAWLSQVKQPVVLEFGAGTNIPTVRWFGESQGAPLVRVNVREPEVHHGQGVGLAMGALAAMTELAGRLTG